MSSISRIRGGLVNAQREVSRHANATSLPNAVQRSHDEVYNSHSPSETLITCPEDAYIKATNYVESDSSIAGDDIIGECSSPSVATQDHPETSATTSNFEDMNGVQEPSAQSSADGVQSTAQRVSTRSAIREFLRTFLSFNTVIKQLGKVARENPMLAAATVVTGAGVAVVAAPALITAPIMGIAGMVGFTPAGVAGGKKSIDILRHVHFHA